MTTQFSLKYRLESDRRPFQREDVRRLPKERTGVYALWLPTGEDDLYDCLYVGKSETCLRRRLLQHLTNETNEELRLQLRMFRDIALFSTAFTTSVEETDALETAVIRAWQPETNREKL